MHVTVRLGDPLWHSVGLRRLSLEAEAEQISVADAFALITARYPQVRAELQPPAAGTGDVSAYQIFVNHQKIPWSRIEDTPLKHGDELVLFLIVVGG